MNRESQGEKGEKELLSEQVSSKIEELKLMEGKDKANLKEALGWYVATRNNSMGEEILEYQNKKIEEYKHTYDELNTDFGDFTVTEINAIIEGIFKL
jgi:hypothetical protein